MMIESCGNQRWRVAVPVGRDPATGKQLYHYKSIRGSKKDAEAYLHWINTMLLVGQRFPATISQSELRQLQALQAKADRFREKLEAAVQAGAKVEPGELAL